MKNLFKELKEKHEYYKSRDEVAPYIQVIIAAIELFIAGMYAMYLVNDEHIVDFYVVVFFLLLGGIFKIIEKILGKYIINEKSKWITKF